VVGGCAYCVAAGWGRRDVLDGGCSACLLVGLAQIRELVG
jgi:hypothetical protein